jgi:hypothetical protein
MKKTLFALLFLVFLFASFRGGTWYSQRWVGESHNAGGERPILHYVDPMNPANVSDKPGIAPCGMPMEPVYGDTESGVGEVTAAGRTMPSGTVKITPRKQQIIGVQVGTAERVSETHEIRALGRIAADENRIYSLVSAADGWMSYIPEGTIGSLIQKDQLMALINIYSYDFFSWQQRYLTELANTGRRRLPATNFSGARQPLAQSSRFPQAVMSPSEATLPPEMSSQGMKVEKTSPAVPQQTALSPEVLPSAPVPQPEQSQPAAKSSLGMPFSAMQSRVSPSASSQSEILQPEKSPSDMVPPVANSSVSLQAMSDHMMHEEDEPPADNTDTAFIREDDILYANKAKLELLNLGVGATQLEELARSGKYVKTIEVRSPITGLVIDRRVSPLQKVERGTECFRVADLSRVWIVVDVFNTDAQYIQPGMSARISLPRRNQYIEAKVSDVLPPFDAKTRTLKVRLEMDNPDYLFRPEMFVDVEFLVTLSSAVTVPADAVLDSGRRKVVFIALKDGYFEPREVVTGWRFGDRVEIVKGLAPGEQFVISGNFLIDSESRMKLAVSGRLTKPEMEKGSPGKSKAGPADQGEHRHD